MNYGKEKGKIDPFAVAWLSMVMFFITCFAAWITHIVVCLSEDAWGFLIAGAIVFPIAIIHGIGIWFGAF